LREGGKKKKKSKKKDKKLFHEKHLFRGKNRKDDEMIR
jgi:hypothetical protein